MYPLFCSSGLCTQVTLIQALNSGSSDPEKPQAESAAHLRPVSRGDGEGLDEGPPPMAEKKGGLSTGTEGPS